MGGWQEDKQASGCAQACGTQSAVPVHGCLGQGMAGQDVLQMQQLISMMSPAAQAVQTVLQEQLGAGMQAGMTQSFESRDVFSRSEKWLDQPPVTHAEKWSTREQEVAGFADYVVSLKVGQHWRALCLQKR